MFRTTLVSAAMLLACCASAGPLNSADRLYFEVHPGDASDVELRVERNSDRQQHSNWSRSVPLSELRGLARDAFAQGGRVQFSLVHPAGTLTCQGLGHDGRADGACTLAPNTGFADRLAARGIGRPDNDQTFVLTMSGVSLDVLDALRTEGWKTPTLDELVQLGIFRITADVVRNFADVGYKGGAIQTLVAFKIHGVTPEAIREYAGLGYQRISGDNLIAFRIHRVTPDYVRSMRALGLRDLSPETLIQLRIFNITPDYVRAFSHDGKVDFDARQLIKLRLTGVGPQRAGAGK